MAKGYTDLSEEQKRKYNDINNRYKRDNSKVFRLRLYNSKDQDMIDWIESKSSMQGYIKELIRKDMEENK